MKISQFYGSRRVIRQTQLERLVGASMRQLDTGVQMKPESESTQHLPVSEIIAQTLQPFDHRSAIVEPFDNESKRDVEFLESMFIFSETYQLQGISRIY